MSSSLETIPERQLVDMAAGLIDEIEQLVAKGGAANGPEQTVHILNQTLAKQGEVARIQAEVHRRHDGRDSAG